MTLFERLEGFRTPKYTRVKRGTESYEATARYVVSNLERLVDLYDKTRNDEQTARLIRDDVDNALRRYHQYCIKENIGAHYFEKGVEGNGIFEHMIPASRIRDLLLLGRITAAEACNAPTCRLSISSDQLLKDNGWNSDTPDLYDFWKRYRLCFDTKGCFETHDGVIIDTESWTLDKHYAYYLHV
mgnify:CR=1 FL=1